ncbi:MAG: glycerol acyltransferase [Prevotella sp.]|nr:glycerol acyltransferase [Prevotella sp.]MDY6230725.1 glycerol acyltransferase [Prevotella sp.]MDY6408611.1 glycerol acyltransferase [Prevotella sp.]
MIEVTEKTIDIEAVLRSKMGEKVRLVPAFVKRWLKKIIHQDEVNAFLWENKEKTGVEWLWATVRYLDMRLEVEGEENLPDPNDGHLYTFVSNHPLGGIDGVALGAIIGRHYDGKFRYLVNDLLMNLPGLAPLCIPINKTGAQSRNFPAMVEAGFNGENHILMFPAGLCSRKTDGKIADLEWKKAFVTKSVEHQRNVIPIHFSGQNSNKFYRIANICKKLGIKFNIAMLFLVDEMYKNRHKSFKITIGKPISWETFDRSKSPAKWANLVRARVYENDLLTTTAPLG